MFAHAAPSLLDRYDALVAQGALTRDGAQVAAVEQLEALAHALARPAWRETSRGIAARAWSLLGGKPKHVEPPRGLYFWGAVGRGKTTLMDLFFEALDTPQKRRAHFHAFMAETHERLHRARREAKGDPVARVARGVAAETRVLCFDEFAVNDIADATILARLFSTLFEAGVTVVATSNVEPRRLYEGGRNRDLFLPFIALLEQRMRVFHLDARADFRMERAAFGEVYFSPADARARAALDALFLALSSRAQGEPAALEIKRRKIDIPQAAGRVARFSFSEICGRPLGATDYMALTQAYDAIIVENVPIMGDERRNEARRFITLVDVLYEAKTLLAISAEAEAAELCRVEHGAEAREFCRAASRLAEMRSREWLEGRAAWGAAKIEN